MNNAKDVRRAKDSQNFLHNKALVEKLLDISNITGNDFVIEIGPGKGIITEALDKKCKQVIAVEYDEQLYRNLLTKKWRNTRIINADFLSYEFTKGIKVKIFSNIPFNMTTDIFLKVLKNFEVIEDFYVIMQKEAAERFIGTPYKLESLKSLLFKPIFSGNIIHEFIKTDFSPIPNVRIVLAHFQKKEYCDIKKAPIIMYWDMLVYLYNHKGSTFKEKTKDIFSYQQQKRVANAIKLDMVSPISLWTFEQWMGIFNCYKQFVPSHKQQQVNGAFKKQDISQKKLNKVHRSRNY
ncbi:MAG: rRNA adenine N(6)-methyltransferase family protein [Bacilli bacterium]|jgi:23S rRNA (adenine-N6)-dimethyltransferase|nr:rRNA adenine N(6)-methyltransferase family protein [Bacilli bacterium]